MLCQGEHINGTHFPAVVERVEIGQLVTYMHTVTYRQCETVLLGCISWDMEP